jgi:N-acetylglutamate synthase-like GNAT family acetyltransferase
MKIQLLTKKDIKEASRIVGMNYSKKYEDSSSLELKEMFSKAPVRPYYYVAKEGNTVVGFAGYMQSWMDYNVYQIFWVNVDPQYQKKGIGKLLVGKIVEEIKKKKKVKLILLTTSSPLYYEKHFNFKTIESFNECHHLMSLAIN